MASNLFFIIHRLNIDAGPEHLFAITLCVFFVVVAVPALLAKVLLIVLALNGYPIRHIKKGNSSTVLP